MRRLVLLALPGSLVSQGAADEPGIYGYVLAPGGIPVSGGTVAYLWFAESASTSIDRIGRFRIPVDRAGVYRVAVSVPGFAPYQFRVTVPASRTLRLPVIRLEPATYFRVRFVSPAGEPITSPTIRRRSFDGSGAPIFDAPDATSLEVDGDGATRIGPLPHGITALALDVPIFAQTRVPNVSVTGADTMLDGGTTVVQPGSTLHVLLEDVLPLSPLQFPAPVRTDAEGRATFERLAAGRYRVRTGAVERCVTQDLSLARTVTASGTGTVNTRIFLAGKATFRISLAGGPVKGMVVSARPDNPAAAAPMLMMGRGAPSPIALSLSTTRCRSTTDADGRITLTSFPPGPTDIAVHFANSLYVRRIDVPIGGGEIAVSVPDGVLPVRIINAVKKAPVPRAFVTWTIEGGGRAEATATVIGEALLEGVGTRPGILTVTAPGFQPAEEHLAEPPGILHEVELVPLPDASLLVRVVTASGDALPNAVVEVAPLNPLDGASDRGVEPPGRLSLGPLPPGDYVIELRGAGEQRQERIRIVDRDVVVPFR